MSTEQRPEVDRVLASLKDFQRATVELVHERLWGDDDPVKKFLVADEVGLGKTMVAKGVIARTVDHLWETDKRVDVVYLCSNSQIARQNLSRLNVVGGTELRHADRLTLLPKVIRDLRGRRINFVSFTPGTSFQVGSSAGKSEERVLLYWMLTAYWGRAATKSAPWRRFFEGWMSRNNFERALRAFDQDQLDEELCRSFGELVETSSGPDGGPLRAELQDCVHEFRWMRGQPSGELARRRDRLIGAMRGLVARASVHHLEPDLVILDEFQRFKDLLDTDDAGAQLAHAIFDHPDAKVLMLSATPYKMYTLPDDPESDDHYTDFTRTVRFLAGDDRARLVEDELRAMRESLLAGGDRARAREARDAVERELRRVMSRTERLSSTPDRDGMLAERCLDGVRLTADDVRAWRTFDGVARHIDHHDVLEYWRSTPYPLNLMERGTYQVRTKFQAAVERGDAEIATALASGAGLLDWEAVRRYEQIDPGNAKMRGLAADVLDRGAWRLAWIAPSLPYSELGGAYAEEDLRSFTKRLVFSAWTVVPKAVATLLSYGAERRAMNAVGDGSALARRAYDDRPITPPLQFRMTSGDSTRPAGMSTLALLYPSSALARLGDPLDIARSVGALPLAQEVVLECVRGRIADRLQSLPPGLDGAVVDQRWYWAAPLLLDAVDGDDGAIWHFLGSSGLDDDDTGSGLDAHLRLAESVDGLELGPRPADLVDVLARLALAGPGVCALRALSRVAGGARSLRHPEIRARAFDVAQGLRSLFNKPEIVAVLRAEEDERYWQAVLDHCFDGGLQAVLDEYAHVLVESEGLQDADKLSRAETLAETMVEALSTRAVPNTIEQVRVDGGRVLLDDSPRMRSHFAARYGRMQSDEKSAVRESTVRVAYNSPFRPFVLASTSVGQEGLDFHTYSHAIVHWNLPGNPVDLEQREGRVHRYKGHAVRKNVAADHGAVALTCIASDPWAGVFDSAARARAENGSDITPFWVYTRPDGAVIERYVPALPLSREQQRYRRLQRTVGAYRLVIGQPRQDDLLRYVGHSDEDTSWLRIDLTPAAVEIEPFDDAGSPATETIFDPMHDEPPYTPNPWGNEEEALLAAVLYNGGLLGINVREGRGATPAEHREIARRAGYLDARGVAGVRSEHRSGGRWVTVVGRRELEGSAQALGFSMPADLTW